MDQSNTSAWLLKGRHGTYTLTHGTTLFTRHDRDTKSSFTSLSQQLASILRDFHSAVIHALAKEDHPQVTALVFKLACTLVNNCPYDRLAPGYLTRLYKAALLKWSQACMLLSFLFHLVKEYMLTQYSSMISRNIEDSHIASRDSHIGNGLSRRGSHA